MGIDLLDMAIRMEKEFGVGLGFKEMEAVTGPRAPWDITASEVAEAMRARLRKNVHRAALADAADLWPRVQKVIAASVNVKPDRVEPGSWLVKDLGFS